MPFLRLETATPTETEKTIAELKKQIGQKDQKLQEIEDKITKIEPLLDFVSDHPYFEALLKDLEEGRYAKIESEHSAMVAQYPKRVFEELVKRAEAEGKDYIEFTHDQLRKMSLEKESQRKTTKAKDSNRSIARGEPNTNFKYLAKPIKYAGKDCS
jgi:hypothetical protein